ncbi:hypothetical protein KAFR_0C00820 [Kazachstania africana CBS 2517]|uniref:ABC transporter domain-containing protein n=1 Tax=Kazachstania africana (strain ATCC 22294 / BCRC 22015 / CBS 2517 / CECT 1963 / NBRC 1671 / NRRL Y-8276) TaxID=1071382 RepID=H2ARS7_KAZAF|nr:hypothetical protein KAFR_0C00820 [Kazachstania africana CBS 2517]CCF57077.1 hypothetical protein KAFR_0C00820 [Kazachstania africana CBS 2517]
MESESEISSTPLNETQCMSEIYQHKDSNVEGKPDGLRPDTSEDKFTGMLTSSSDERVKENKHLTHNRNESSLSDDMTSKVEQFAEALARHTSRSGEFKLFSDNGSSSQDSEREFDANAIFDSFVKDSEEQGIHIRRATVTIENLSVQGFDKSSMEGKTFGNFLLLPLTIYRAIKNKRRNRMTNILQNINGLANAGEMVLVLGRPGAGCSSFLKATAGEISQFAGGVTGDVSYDGIPQKEMMKKYKSDVIYNGEVDVHFPYLTVQQTLDFAIACKTPSTRVNNVSRKEYIESRRDLFATIFGLTHTYHTKVGNDFVRGVSGGERKRVSIAEALAANGSVYLWDNATRGLDASTALEYAKAIRIMTNLLGSTAFVTIYQASENIYETFDKVTVLHSGRQIYFGKIEDAKKYFTDMGYICPPRQVTAEFLTALTDPHGFHKVKPGYEDKVPRTAEEFENYWRNSPELLQLKREIEDFKSRVDTTKTKKIYNESLSQEKSKYTRKQSYYTVSYFEQVRLCTIRGLQRIYGNKSYTVINICSAIIQAFISGSLFYNSPSTTNGAFSRGGVLYFCLLYYSLMGLANIRFDYRPILQKQKLYSFYHPSAEALGSTFSAFPFRMIGLTCFLIILYFLSGLRRSAGAFFIVYLFLTLCSEAITGLFEMVAAACDTMAQANSIAGILMMSISMYSTYMIQLPSMHPWFKWISYVLPIRYAFESMLNAEFHGRHMDCGGTLVPSGQNYENVAAENRVCAFVGSEPGQSWVLGDNYLRKQFEYVYKHVWRNFGIMWCFVLGYITLKAIITEYKTPVKDTGDALIYKKGSKSYKMKNDEESNHSSENLEPQEKYSSGSTAEESTDAIFEELESKGVFIWKDVCYTIPYDGGQRMLLDHVSGFCKPGTLTALMGESGAGKTTLLNTLAQRNVGIITGDMLVNGHPIDTSFERRTGYVQQQDIHISELTVRESLQFSARMRRPQSVTDKEKMTYVEKIIHVLDMEDYAEALVGTVGSGLNVEQRKKLSIGVELVAKPDLLLFLDEPTSGLDSQSSWAIVQLLKKLAHSGQSILCTIHQPSATLFEQFDRLLLLKKGGQTVYFGNIGENSSLLLDYFERNGARQCSSSENPAEYILEAIGAGATATVKEDWNEIWRNSPESRNSQNEITELIENLSKEVDPSKNGAKPSKYATSYLYQFRYVWARTNVTFWRSLNYIMSKFMLMAVGGLYIGFTFFDVGNSYVGLQNALFAAFISIVLSAPAMNQIQARAIASRELFEVRESKSNMFHWSLLLITQYLSELPYHLVFSIIFFVSSYFPLRNHFGTPFSGVYFLNYCIMFQLYYVGFGLLILYMAPNLPSANVILGLALSFLIAFCGVVQPKSLMPGFWTFMWKTSPFTYFVQNLVGIMLHTKAVVCTSNELNYFNPPSGQTCGEYMQNYLQTHSGYIANPSATSNCGYCLYSVGDQYLTHISSKYSYLWRNFGFFWVYIIFNIFAMVGVYYIFHVRDASIFNLKFVEKLISHIRKSKKKNVVD